MCSRHYVWLELNEQLRFEEEEKKRKYYCVKNWSVYHEVVKTIKICLYIETKAQTQNIQNYILLQHDSYVLSNTADSYYFD